MTIQGQDLERIKMGAGKPETKGRKFLSFWNGIGLPHGKEGAALNPQRGERKNNHSKGLGSTVSYCLKWGVW